MKLRRIWRNIGDAFEVLFRGRDHFISKHCRVHERLGDLKDYFQRIEGQKDREFRAREKALSVLNKLDGSPRTLKEAKAIERYLVEGKVKSEQEDEESKDKERGKPK